MILSLVEKIRSSVVTATSIVEIGMNPILAELVAACEGKVIDPSADTFLKTYDELLIVNPTKAKFKHTLLNQTYYELLRIYSNELEKENSVLFVMGFSFADEHIREITIRAANSNPTLTIYIIAHSSSARDQMQKNFGLKDVKNGNIQIISPIIKDGKDAYKYDLPTINNRIFRAFRLGDHSQERRDETGATNSGVTQ